MQLLRELCVRMRSLTGGRALARGTIDELRTTGPCTSVLHISNRLTQTTRAVRRARAAGATPREGRGVARRARAQMIKMAPTAAPYPPVPQTVMRLQATDYWSAVKICQWLASSSTCDLISNGVALGRRHRSWHEDCVRGRGACNCHRATCPLSDVLNSRPKFDVDEAETYIDNLEKMDEADPDGLAFLNEQLSNDLRTEAAGCSRS